MMRLFRPAPLLVLAFALLPAGASAQGVTAQGSTTIMTREEFADASRRGINLAAALEDRFLGLNAVGGSLSGYCLEYRQVRAASLGCRALAVYVDGIRVADVGYFLAFQPVDDIERAEVLSALDATTRYGALARFGALLIETRTGGLPSADDRHVSGLDWSLETKPYPWAKVLGSTFLANAAGFGIGQLLTDRCFGDDTGYGNSYRCGAPASTGTRVAGVMLPIVAGSFAARWAGTTDRSRGRLIPAAILGSITGAAGYLMFVDEGGSGGSDDGRVVGALLMTVVTPLVTVFSDRLFRVLR